MLRNLRKGLDNLEQGRYSTHIDKPPPVTAQGSEQQERNHSQTAVSPPQRDKTYLICSAHESRRRFAYLKGSSMFRLSGEPAIEVEDITPRFAGEIYRRLVYRDHLPIGVIVYTRRWKDGIGHYGWRPAKSAHYELTDQIGAVRRLSGFNTGRLTSVNVG